MISICSNLFPIYMEGRLATLTARSTVNVAWRGLKERDPNAPKSPVKTPGTARPKTLLRKTTGGLSPAVTREAALKV